VFNDDPAEPLLRACAPMTRTTLEPRLRLTVSMPAPNASIDVKTAEERGIHTGGYRSGRRI